MVDAASRGDSAVRWFNLKPFNGEEINASILGSAHSVGVQELEMPWSRPFTVSNV
jgi:hypothetical protein